MHASSSRPSECLITGASGFIGKRLCQRFDASGVQIYVPLVRKPGLLKPSVHAPRVAVADLLDGPRLNAALAGCDAVIHLAHGHRAVEATRQLLACSVKQKIRRFVHVSTMSVHGPHPGPEASREVTARIGRYDHDYSDSKAEQEELVQEAHDRGDIEAVILRPTIVYGADSHFVRQIVEQSRAGEVKWFDHGEGIYNAVYIDDVCDAIEAALVSTEAVGQAMFINGNENISWHTFIKAFAQCDGAVPRFKNLSSADAFAYWEAHPPVVAKSLIDRIAFKIRRLAGKVPETPPWPPLGHVQREKFPIFFANDKAKRLLGWSPRVSFEQGVALTMAGLHGAEAVE